METWQTVLKLRDAYNLPDNVSDDMLPGDTHSLGHWMVSACYENNALLWSINDP